LTLLAATLGALILGTRMRNDDYRSNLTLWAPDDMELAYTMLAGRAIYRSQLDEAVELLDEMLRVSQTTAGAPFSARRAEVRTALATVRVLQNRRDEAARILEQVLDDDPAYVYAANNLAVVRTLSGDYAG